MEPVETVIKMQVFRERNVEALEEDEKQYLERLKTEELRKLRSAKLRAWPIYFPNKEACGEELQTGLVWMWTNYIVVETLLAAVAIQPLVSTQNGLVPSQQREFGILWMLALISDLLGLAVTAVFLGYLLSVPRKLTWFWMIELGSLIRRLPTLILMFNTVLTLMAIDYSTWTLYGLGPGVLCVVVQTVYVVFGASIYRYLASASDKIRPMHREEESREPRLQLNVDEDCVNQV